MAISIIDLAEQAAQLRRPFELAEIAQVDELGVFLYVSHGRFGWHRHVDEDELFLVLSGMVNLESEWGAATLHAGEMVLMPKGVGHRSISLWRSTVMLLRPKLLAQVQNGQRRLYGLAADNTLQKIAVSQAAAGVPANYDAHLLAALGAYAVTLRRGMGFSAWEQHPTATLVLAHLGRVMVETPLEQVSLAAGHLALIPTNASFRLAAAGDCVLLQVRQQTQPGASPPAPA